MEKSGVVTLNIYDNCRPIALIWYGGSGLYERIDFTTDPESYNVLNTSSCLASYYRKGSEKYLGRAEVIQAFFKIKHDASLNHGLETKDVSVEDGAVILIVTKKEPDINLEYTVVLKNGRIKSEYYQTADGSITITEVTDAIELEMRPVNIEDYSSYGSFAIVKSTGTAIHSANYYSYDELLRMYPQVRHVLDNDYVVISSYEEAEERLNIWINSKEKYKSYDIESLDTVWGIFSENRITGVFLGFGETWSTYFPFRQDNFDYNLPIEYLKKIFNAINNQPPAPEVIIMGYNMLFEMEGFYQEFRQWIRVDVDVYLLAALIDTKIRKGSHTLKAQAALVDGRFYLTLEKIFIGKVQFNVLPPEIVKIYGCPDVTSPVKVYKSLIKKLPKNETFVFQLHCKLIKVKALNEFYGLRLDQDRLRHLIAEEQYKVDILRDTFMRMHRTSRNINSYAVMKEILYDKMHCKVYAVTKDGKPATSKVVITKLIEKGALKDYDKEHLPAPICDINGNSIIEGKDLASNKYPSLLVYQQYKLALKELGALNRLVKKSQGDRFMFYINQVGAGSNRQTSDAHQFSDTMKSCVIADSPYHNLVSCDWMQVELRVLAWMAKQDDLIEMERDPNVDIHRAIASIIHKIPMYLISEEMRKADKSVNFGVVYGMTEYGLAKQKHGAGATKEQIREEAINIINFFNGLPNVKRFIQENKEFLYEHGYVETLFHYRRYFNEILDPTISNKLKRSIERAAGNTPIQGTAAQMMKIAELNIQTEIEKRGWDQLKDYDGVMLPMVRLMLPIHDENLLSCDKSIPMEEIIIMLKDAMELNFKGAPPFFAPPAFVNNWFDGKDPSYEIQIPYRDDIIDKYKRGIVTFGSRPYLDILKEYRTNRISKYMNDLIRKHKTVDEVIKHVDDDNLTHTLIEAMIPKSERKHFTHEERIAEATRRYVESNGGTIVDAVPSEDFKEDTPEYTESLDEWVNHYAYTTADGELIEESDEDENEEMGATEIEDEESSIQEQGEELHVLYTSTDCLINITGLDPKGIGQKIHEGVIALSNPDEFYRVVYISGSKIIDTGMHIGYISEEIEKLFSLEESEELNNG